MKKILIYSDDKLFGEIQRDIDRFIPRLEKMKNAYEALDMGFFTNEVMTKIKTQGESSIEADFYQNIKSQLDAAGITMKIVRQNMVNGSEATLLEFKNAFQEARNFEPPQYVCILRPVLNFTQISYNDESKVFEIDSETKENISETFCKIYLTNEVEKNIYDSLQNFVKAQAEVKNSLAEAGYSYQNKDYKLEEIVKVFLTQSPSVSVKPGAVKYAAGQRAQKEQVKKMQDRMHNRV